jgi:hypothetical protein
MPNNEEARRLARAHGLEILDLTWEDTGRYKDSSVGPNISDMTIQVGHQRREGTFEVTCMPVIRFANFSDTTCDLSPRDFTLLVGNEKGDDLKRISLLDFLADPIPYLSNPDSWKAKEGQQRTLIAERDSKVLVSAQACFLPVPKEGKATFNPVIFNYQSMVNDPAVLTILATPEGSSVTIIDNLRDAFDSGSAWGQRLFFNSNGQRASLTGERQSEHLKNNSGNAEAKEGQTVEVPSVEGMNMVLLIQVPLKTKRPIERGYSCSFVGATAAATLESSDVENAVIGHGDLEGPFTEIDNLEIERDGRFPVRVTVQFYKATSNGVISENDVKEIKDQIDRIYAQSYSVGSLVTAGETGRVTEYAGAKVQPPGWWDAFWVRHEKNTGDNREVALRKLRQLLGDSPESLPVSDLYLRDLLRRR